MHSFKPQFILISTIFYIFLYFLSISIQFVLIYGVCRERRNYVNISVSKSKYDLDWREDIVINTGLLFSNTKIKRILLF